MSTLLANQAIDLAIAGLISAFALLIGAVAAYVQVRTKQAEQGAQLSSLQKQVDQQATPAGATVVTVPSGVGTVHVESSPVVLPPTEGITGVMGPSSAPGPQGGGTP